MRRLADVAVLLVMIIALLQGGVVFATALLLAHLMRLQSGWWKLALMLGSWLAWCIITLAGFAVVVGGGLMEGFGLALAACALASFGTCTFAIGWIAGPWLRNASSADQDQSASPD